MATYTTPSKKPDRTTRIRANDAFISSDDNDMYIERAIRAFNPWPVAWTTLGELLLIAQRFDKSIDVIRINKDPKTRVQLHTAHVENEILFLDDVQAAGKKSTPWKEFRNGWFSTHKS